VTYSLTPLLRSVVQFAPRCGFVVQQIDTNRQIEVVEIGLVAYTAEENDQKHRVTAEKEVAALKRQAVANSSHAQLEVKYSTGYYQTKDITKQHSCN